MNMDVANVSIPVNRTQNEAFAIQITATNQLNLSESDVVQVHLADIVVPVTPVITKIYIQGSDFIILIYWRNQTSENQRSCQLEYNTLTEPAWTLIGEKININNNLSIKKIRRAHSLRVRCREEIGHSYWSKWSELHLIPPSAPEDQPVVWRIVGPEHPNGTQEITILIKPDLDELQERRISGYEVFYLYNGIRSVLRWCSPFGIQCLALVPKNINSLFISANNPYGSSPESELPIQEKAESDLPAPRNLTAVSGLLTSIPVRWQRPNRSDESLQGFIVQWAPDSCDGKQKNISWQKILKEETTFTIIDQISPGNMVTISVYALYSSGVSRPSTTYGYSQEFEPKTGPKSKLEDSRYIRWTEIPPCDRRGFITVYKLYLKQESNGLQMIDEFPESTRDFVLDRFNPDELYSVCISASTKAGEGPADHCTLFQHDNSLHNYLGLLLGMSFGAIVLTAFVFTLSAIRKRVKTALALWLPKYLREEYPRVDNSSAVKSLQANTEDTEPPFYPLYSDPDITEIQELLQYQATGYQVTPAECTDGIEETVVADGISLNLPTNDDVPEFTVVGYRPQVGAANIQRFDSYCSPSHMLDIQTAALRCERRMVASDTQENTLLWDDGAEVDLNVFKEINLLVVDDIDPTEEFGFVQTADDHCTLKIKWKPQVVSRDQLMCTLPSGHQELYNSHSYFPQMFAKGNEPVCVGRCISHPNVDHRCVLPHEIS
ncbi:interleukin-31 receptor subunit alpha-like isoform X2 [Mixophyes fleayi]